MSFFKKLTSEIKELIGDKDEKSKHDLSSESNRDQSPLVQPYPQQHHNEPNQYTSPPGQTQLPPGWSCQWDQNSQRWYYIEQASGRSQWEPPSIGYGGVPFQDHASGSYVQTNHNNTSYGPTLSTHGYDEKHKNNEKRGMIAAGAGGLAVGALAGAALSGDSSDDDQGHPYVAGPTGYHVESAAPVVPLEHNPELSSSQRSSLEEARKDYQEAQQEVAEDSDPSSSDVEELEEAREEYLSEVESAHEELED